jgi:hypothetical protein
MYDTLRSFRRTAIGGKIGVSNRKSFIDVATNSSFTPGPGNYKLPTEFGHYKKYP